LGKCGGFQHGFPLIRSLRASVQWSTSVLFSFVRSVETTFNHTAPCAVKRAGIVDDMRDGALSSANHRRFWRDTEVNKAAVGYSE
jgi:hypothetical protein